MAIYDPKTGLYRGKIGKNVFYVLNGKQLMRTIGKSSKPPSLAQLKLRKELAVVIIFLKPFNEFINIGFMNVVEGTNKIPYNAAVSYHKRHALKGIYPNIEIDYEKVRVTEGPLSPAAGSKAELLSNGLKFSWLCGSEMEWPRESDQTMLIVYFPGVKKVIYVIYGAERRKLTEVLKLPEDMIGEHMEVYLSFISANRKETANSSYLGSFNRS